MPKMSDPWMWHMGRSFVGHPLEDACPCPKAPCGLIISDQIDESCDQHPMRHGKTYRQGHRPEDCPGKGE